MPIAMIGGGLLHKIFAPLNPLTPYLIFFMLFITFCRISLKEMRINMLHWSLIAFQLIVSLAVYFVVRFYDESAAQGAMMCVLVPTATAAVVMAVMLGAKVENMATYNFLCNIILAVAIPLLLSWISTSGDILFWDSFVTIGSKVFPLLIMPLVCATVLKAVWMKGYLAVQGQQSISFYLWVCTLTIVSARTVDFFLEQPSSSYGISIATALIAFVICALQFILGRKIGRRFGDPASGGQCLGQKNTVLAIWICQTFLNPIASVAPAAYVLWQNLANSYQLWRFKDNK